MQSPFEGKDHIVHQINDTDLNHSSPHHTLGNGPTQAARGNHNHDDVYALLGHIHKTTEFFTWNYDTVETMAEPGAGKLRTNVPAGTEASQIAFSALAASGIDIGNLMRMIKRDDVIYFQEGDNAANWGRYEVTGTPTDHTTWFQMGVRGVGENGVGIAKNQLVLIRFTYTPQEWGA